MAPPTLATRSTATGDHDRIAGARGRLPSDVEIDRIATLFRLMSDPTRAKILYCLLAAGEMRVADIAQTVGASESNVSHALRLLRTGDVVANRRDGRSILYRLHDDHIRSLLDLLLEHARHDSEDPR
ncbi:helix-turn-helix transcriptional regulator [Iamia sp. SCSIO 61187]|uniref:ArsR/SmtB family transcription factor n=1 Tax=Iamia sp. SCSIO 61187 TaxID=2722752 RepID=UPI001C633121|nr:metalloregulator ArsR/SmtB family transcription factor [Iamia sp. SCSIO 61187]